MGHLPLPQTGTCGERCFLFGFLLELKLGIPGCEVEHVEQAAAPQSIEIFSY